MKSCAVVDFIPTFASLNRHFFFIYFIVPRFQMKFFCLTSTHLRVDPFDSFGRVLDPAIEVDGPHVLGARLLPRVPVAQPIISLFHLSRDMGWRLV